MEDAVKLYLAALLSGHRFNKTTLAKAMDTSRGQLDAALKGGRVTVDHVNGIAAATTGRVSSVLLELYEFAKEVEAKAINDSGPTPRGQTAHFGNRSYVTPRVQSDAAKRPPAPVPLSRATRRRRQK